MLEPCNTILTAKAINSFNSVPIPKEFLPAKYLYSLKSVRVLEIGTVESGDPSVLKNNHSISSKFSAESVLRTLYNTLIFYQKSLV